MIGKSKVYEKLHLSRNSQLHRGVSITVLYLKAGMAQNMSNLALLTLCCRKDACDGGMYQSVACEKQGAISLLLFVTRVVYDLT